MVFCVYIKKKLARAPVTASHFQPKLAFIRAGLQLDRLLKLHSNIILGQKLLAAKNTLAYCYAIESLIMFFF